MMHQDESQRNQPTRDTSDGAGDQSARWTAAAQQPHPIHNSSNGEQLRVDNQRTYPNTPHNNLRPQEYDGFMNFQTHGQHPQGPVPNGGLHGNIPNPYMFPHYSAPGPMHYQPHIFPSAPTGISATQSEPGDPLPPPSNQLQLQRVAVPAAKIAGSRRSDPKGKGKQKAVDDNEQPVASGSGTKRKAADVDSLLDHTEKHLPLGGNGWLDVEQAYNAEAAESDRPQRSAKSLKLKFKQLVKTTKPTGDAVCPPHVLRAHEIDEAMNEKVGTLDLDDEEIVDAEDDSLERPSKKTPTLVLRRPTPDSRGAVPSLSSRHSRAASQGMLGNISAALDPARLQARHEEQSIQAMQANQIFQLSSQLREAQRRADSLSTQLFEAERRAAAAERLADRNEVMGMMCDRRFSHRSSLSSSPLHRYGGYWSSTPSRRRRGYRSSTPSRRRRGGNRSASPSRRREHPFKGYVPRPRSNPPHERRRYRQDIYYANGGQATRWIGGSSDEEDVTGFNDSPGTRRVVNLNDSIVLPPRCSPSPLPSAFSSRSPSPQQRGESSSSALRLLPAFSWSPSPSPKRRGESSSSSLKPSCSKEDKPREDK